MLPSTAGIQDPVRLCMACVAEVKPHQAEYAANANCHRPNKLTDDPVRRSLPLAVQPHLNNPFTVTLRSAIRNATYTLLEQANPLLIPDHKIPLTILKEARGFLFLSFVRLGFLGGARFGSGLVVTKRRDGTWSAPSAVGMGGLSVGFMAGADCVNLCLVMNSSRVCEILASRGQLAFDGEIGASVGPIGRTASIGVNIGNDVRAAVVYSYCQSRGLFAGIDLNGSVIVTRKNANHKFYGVRYQASDILEDVPQPEAAQPLYDAIAKATCAVPQESSQEQEVNAPVSEQVVNAPVTQQQSSQEQEVDAPVISGENPKD